MAATTNEAPPGTQTQSYLFYSTDDGTELICVSPSNGLPVSGSFTVTPSGTQDVNVKNIGGTTVLTGAGATGAGAERVTVAQDSTTIAGSSPTVLSTIATNTTNAGTPTVTQGPAAAVTGGWPIIAGEPADTTGTFTNATQTTAITTPAVDGYPTALITIHGTYAGATATFQASDDGGATYYPIVATRTDGTAAETGYTGLTNVSRAWVVSGPSFDTIQVLSSAVTSGTANVRISLTAATATIGGPETIVQPTASNLNAQVQGVDAVGATVTAKSVSVGGEFNTTPTVITNGQKGNIQLNASSEIVSQLVGVSNGGADGLANTLAFAGLTTAPASQRLFASTSYLFNASLWDRPRSIQGADGTGLGVVAMHESPNSNVNAGIVPQVTSTVASSLVAKASAGNLYALNVVSGASQGYVMLFNATSAPADGTVTPTKVWVLAANSSLNFEFSPPIRLSTGITLVYSTTGPFSKTASATAFISADIV